MGEGLSHVRCRLIHSNLVASSSCVVPAHRPYNRKTKPILHEFVGDLLATSIPPGCTLIKDPACRGKQRIPLFCSDAKSRQTEFCNVDLLIVADRQIRVIVEIEEATVTPTQIGGKFLTSALASHFIHDGHGGVAIPKADRVWFLQFVDTSGLPGGSSKRTQWRNVEAGIRSLLPLGGITDYWLFDGDQAELGGQNGRRIVEAITQASSPPS